MPEIDEWWHIDSAAGRWTICEAQHAPAVSWNPSLPSLPETAPQPAPDAPRCQTLCVMAARRAAA